VLRLASLRRRTDLARAGILLVADALFVALAGAVPAVDQAGRAVDGARAAPSWVRSAASAASLAVCARAIPEPACG